jgi:hypothetical protein
VFGTDPCPGARFGPTHFHDSNEIGTCDKHKINKLNQSWRDEEKTLQKADCRDHFCASDGGKFRKRAAFGQK